MKRSGFTMIELIFVIVILGILAAVAIPKLAATRDDATLAKEIANAKTCVNDAGAFYTANGSLTGFKSPACDAAKTGTKVTATVNDSSVTIGGDDAPKEIAGQHDFGGTKVKFN